MDYPDKLGDVAMQALAEMDVMPDLQYSLATPKSVAIVLGTAASHRYVSRRREKQAAYLLRLEYPLSSPQHDANNLKLSRVPHLEVGSGGDGETRFCHLNQSGVGALEDWTAKNHPKKKWTKI